MTIANVHVDSRLKLVKITRQDLGGTTEWHASFDPKELTSFADALLQFSDKMLAEVGYRIDLTTVEIKHDPSFRANGFVFRERE